ncbi:peptidoglycan DD-metalloendopeptidase family protein [Pseudooceanicola sp. CBS1P-1]|uniref:Peptidoglycan DD-metalloendopeptidase family protein n=1 Tax=Pseudooceanicola albus TaxID=2692189 RepID=A0A6L7GAG4_9RHOB|nr:peptidoglycan DD-metalloendopeptidase family protein [Pseudooceanicola endophyticus]MXN20672.1 peptidoglycan DD-metalloendopeptidase family protein [Pseudooceanicola albus]
MERYFPERRLFLRSETETRFIRLKPGVQVLGLAGGAAVFAWTIIATAILMMDSLGAGSYRDQAVRDQASYQQSLDSMAQERDSREVEALAAQKRFSTALARVSDMQTELLTSEARRRELETGIDVIQSTLRKTLKERDSARAALAAARDSAPAEDARALPPYADETLDYLSQALTQTAAERDDTRSDAARAEAQADQLENRLALMQDQNDAIFRQLEDAMSLSIKPLNKMFRAAGLNPDTLLKKVKRGYSGQGGPLQPIAYTTSGQFASPDIARANSILAQLDELNLYRIAATEAPFAIPVTAHFRYSSPFGVRHDPKNGSLRHHYGVDLAAPIGTPLYATGDGVITFAGWSTGYGRLIKIRHAFGIETRYGHLSRIRVKVGQRVSRGDRIGDIGVSGRVTGPHVHYEVRVNGKPVDPMTYIKAAKDVF